MLDVECDKDICIHNLAKSLYYRRESYQFLLMLNVEGAPWSGLETKKKIQTFSG